ncbi:Mpo1-like protein [uncultured Marinobacter sp.]|uniref:Mpo1-like protein n=1 Tax=uncultured Marinobacter sp. TaxID=187379 RepID=UPI0030D9BFC2
MSQEYKSFSEFYPYYLDEHRNLNCRRLHFVGSLIVLVILAAVLVTQAWIWLLLVPLVGYGFAWVGHFMFEKNRPATFKHPLYSLMGDWVMFRDILTGRVSIF